VTSLCAFYVRVDLLLFVKLEELYLSNSINLGVQTIFFVCEIFIQFAMILQLLPATGHYQKLRTPRDRAPGEVKKNQRGKLTKQNKKPNKTNKNNKQRKQKKETQAIVAVSLPLHQ